MTQKDRIKERLLNGQHVSQVQSMMTNILRLAPIIDRLRQEGMKIVTLKQRYIKNDSKKKFKPWVEYKLNKYLTKEDKELVW